MISTGATRSKNRNRTLGGKHTEQKIAPGAGPVNQQDETKRQIRERLRQFDPSDVYMVVVVRQDSFPHFRILRDVLIEMGFEYRLMPMLDGMAVRDRGGSRGKVQ